MKNSREDIEQSPHSWSGRSTEEKIVNNPSEQKHYSDTLEEARRSGTVEHVQDKDGNLSETIVRKDGKIIQYDNVGAVGKVLEEERIARHKAWVKSQAKLQTPQEWYDPDALREDITERDPLLDELPGEDTGKGN